MRREFTQKVKVEIIKRCSWGIRKINPHCEQCNQIAHKFEIDHRDPDAMQIDKSRKLTAEDGWLLCIPCHNAKTKTDVANIAKAKRVEAKHLGARRPRQPMPKGAKLRGPERAHEGRQSLPPRQIYEVER